MPELPEVETVRRLIEPHVVGHAITGIEIHDFPAVLETNLPADPASLLLGRTLVGARRRGKYLQFPLDDGNTMVVHLRMTGRLLVMERDAEPVRFEHAVLHLSSGEDLRFADQRKFGRISIFTAEDIERLEHRLGPEPLSDTLTVDVLERALHRRTGSIKGALLDQGMIAGLGNIYVDESLWATRIHPLTPANQLDRAEIEALIEVIRTTMRTAIDNQGTTFSSFENPYGEAGGNARYLKVYGRTKGTNACERCGTPIERLVVAGRGSAICPTCQIAPTGLPAR
ncbi:MAG: DNA-formamidopyrimidine glycosylase [Thermomicrobiales bacterium]